ncbi:hypothetical protein PENCOP_c003G01632 [Penicillium coprophilum]|uniref:Uncharacterized protein n=1 Tax=Penicillium coprophilum TaxID=36646 RepID=A0A1V6UYA5_9EURO|nr:hypothetical protein PENCOP_c003G01632 [Penicillium coprophilum]
MELAYGIYLDAYLKARYAQPAQVLPDEQIPLRDSFGRLRQRRMLRLESLEFGLCV